MSEDRVYIGVDLGGTNVMAGLIDSRGRILSRCKKKVGPDTAPDAVVKRVLAAIDGARQAVNVPGSAVAAVGVGAPGPVDPVRGVVLRAPNLGWSNHPLSDVLSAALKLPVAVDNDVNVGTWAEHVLGAGRGHADMMGLFVGTGIGAGLVLEDRLYHGHFLTAGEIGHTVLHADAPLGRRTLEQCASRTAIGNLLSQLIQASHSSAITEMVGGDLKAIRSKVLARALESGDELTRRVVRQAAEYVGVSIANTVTLLSLPCVVLGGGLTEALGRTWVGWVRKAFEASVFPPELSSCKIVAARLGDDAGMVGAALLARDRFDPATESR
jgi:glucokinase